MTSMYRVLVIDHLQASYLDALDVEYAVFDGEATVEVCRVADEHKIDDRLESAHVVISGHRVALSEASFRRMRSCRGVVRAAVGYDNIDVAAARTRGIPIATIPDYGTEEVADHAITLLLALVRNLRATQNACCEGTWDWRVIGKVRRLRGLRLGLVGFGRIGSAVAMRGRAFGMHCVFYDPFVPVGSEKSHGVERADSLSDLLATCAAISLHVPSTAQTRGMIGSRELATMPPDGVLVNTARGELVDQAALIAHLKDNPEFRAGLDVLANEPTVPLELRTSSQVILSAHSAFYADASLMELRRKAAETARRLYLGKPVGSVVN